MVTIRSVFYPKTVGFFPQFHSFDYRYCHDQVKIKTARNILNDRDSLFKFLANQTKFGRTRNFEISVCIRRLAYNRRPVKTVPTATCIPLLGSLSRTKKPNKVDATLVEKKMAYQ